MYYDEEFEHLIGQIKIGVKDSSNFNAAVVSILEINSLELHNIANELHELNENIKKTRTKPSQMRFDEGGVIVDYKWSDEKDGSC